MSKELNERIKGNGGGLHVDIRLDEPIYIEHGGETLVLIYNGIKSAQRVSVTFQGSKDFKIDIHKNRSDYGR